MKSKTHWKTVKYSDSIHLTNKSVTEMGQDRNNNSNNHWCASLKHLMTYMIEK